MIESLHLAASGKRHLGRALAEGNPVAWTLFLALIVLVAVLVIRKKRKEKLAAMRATDPELQESSKENN
jgi:hypothetical protein